MKKLFTILAVLSLSSLMMISCGRKEEETMGLKFGYTCMTMNNPFFLVIEESIREEIEKNGDTLITLDPQLDSARQVAQVEDMIAQGVDLIFLNPVDWKGIKPALDAAKKAGIPVVNFDADVFDIDLVDAVVKTDNYNAGYICGEDLLKRLPDGGKVAIFDVPTQKSGADRASGFYDAIGGDNSKFEVVSRQDNKGQLEITIPIAEAIVQAHPDIKAFFGLNDPGALGVLAALKATKNDDKGILIYGVDGAPDIKKSIKEGDVTGSGAQSPINIGKDSVVIAYKILNGEAFEKDNLVMSSLITADNVDEYGIDGWQ